MTNWRLLLGHWVPLVCQFRDNGGGLQVMSSEENVILFCCCCCEIVALRDEFSVAIELKVDIWKHRKSVVNLNTNNENEKNKRVAMIQRRNRDKDRALSDVKSEKWNKTWFRINCDGILTSAHWTGIINSDVMDTSECVDLYKTQ